MEDPNQAIEWLMQLITVVPTDSQALCKLGELYDIEGDKSQAFQYYYEVGVHLASFQVLTDPNFSEKRISLELIIIC